MTTTRMACASGMATAERGSSIVAAPAVAGTRDRVFTVGLL